ncbi:MBL fold metallo-hydrolase [Haladaptatus sp. F3-133]|uniref:MBL fold metallo-hydrolase n=1 Tax=Halorutilus salinus TaxID=2487751 RepID=A0A9Q4C3W7_9EURY|nr:MBL fold metallo-hydrolase [Halorutilus salinus]MCX2818621.1 MBL fold metallo-hydrolase [Halorutilus salinus]
MVHSTWGDWFVRQVESTTVEGLSLWYLGGNGFVVRSEDTTVYIDPYFGDGNPPFTRRMIPVPMNPKDATMCDGVLITHEHLDHMHPPSFLPLLDDNPDAKVYAPMEAFEEPEYGDVSGLPDERSVTVEEGDVFELGDINVHVRGANDTDSLHPVSYVIEHDSGVFFHGGDTKPADVFGKIGDEFDIDVGALAFGSVGNVRYPDGEIRRTKWYMDENEVIEVANQLRLDRLVPTHHDLWKGLNADPKVLHEHAASHEYPKSIEVVEVGDMLTTAENSLPTK